MITKLGAALPTKLPSKANALPSKIRPQIDRERPLTSILIRAPCHLNRSPPTPKMTPPNAARFREEVFHTDQTCFSSSVNNACLLSSRGYRPLTMKRIKAAAVQFEHADGNKELNLAKIESFIDKAHAKGVELLIFPECCVTVYWFLRNLSCSELEELAEAVPTGPTCALEQP